MQNENCRVILIVRVMITTDGVVVEEVMTVGGSNDSGGGGNCGGGGGDGGGGDDSGDGVIVEMILVFLSGEDDWNLDSLLRQLEEEIKAHERAMPPSTQASTARKTGPRNDSTSTAASTDQHLFMLFLSSVPAIQWMQDCFRYWREEKDSDEIRRCFICLKEYHISKECHSAIRCRNCGGRHH